MNCNLILKYTNAILLFILAILSYLAYVFVVKGDAEHFSQHNDNFIIKDTTNNVNIMNLDNVSKYIVVNNPAFPSRKMKMIRVYTDSKIILNRNNHYNSDLTLGFYLKKFSGAEDIDFADMLVCQDQSDSNIFSLSYTTNNRIRLEIGNNVLESNIDHLDKYNYIVIQIKNQSQPQISLNVNNVITKLTLVDRPVLSMNKFMFQNFHGYLGKIMLFNSILSKEKLCKNYNCSISCFTPDGVNDYDLDVNKCIKACNDKCDDVEKCQKICVNCEVEGETWDLQTKLSKCPWLKNIKKLDKNVPDAPKIRTYPGNGKILVEWKRPYDNRMPITNYIVLIHESFNKENGLNVTVSSDPKCNICEHEIGNLKNEVYYDISVRAVNGKGIGPPSNIETVYPNGQNKHDIVKNIFMEIDDDLDNLITPEDIDQSCDNKGYMNTENMILDKIDSNNIDIETLVKNMNTQV